MIEVVVVKVVENTVNEVNLQQYRLQWIGRWSLLGDGGVVVVCSSDHRPIHYTLPSFTSCPAQYIHACKIASCMLSVRDICKIILKITSCPYYNVKLS